MYGVGDWVLEWEWMGPRILRETIRCTDLPKGTLPNIAMCESANCRLAHRVRVCNLQTRTAVLAALTDKMIA